MQTKKLFHASVGIDMKCADCQNITRHRQASQVLYTTKHGFSGCALKPAYEYMSRLFERECADYVKKAVAA